jgi:NADPH:quinone reductase-like Zn-dependent oxidoreductase
MVPPWSSRELLGSKQAMSENIPELMTALVLNSFSGVESLRVEQRPTPKPGPNEVLVKVAASPINPSDLAFLEGHYGTNKMPPVIAGFEGSGTVVATGKGLMGKYLLGKKVACLPREDGDGVWAEYMVTSASFALPLGKSVSLEQGAMSVVNPLTALGFLEIVKATNYSTVVQTAAASALGQMMVRLFNHAGIQVINIVRREDQVELLRNRGVKNVLNSSDSNFDKNLAELCEKMEAKLAFDAVSGSITMRLLSAMPRDSRIIVYGGLSFEAAQADPGQLIFANKSLEGFWLSSWLRKKNALQNLLLWRKVQKLITTDLASEIRSRYALQDAKEAIKDYQHLMTGGKILLTP